MTVQDLANRSWNVKFPPEARTEVVASRILWAVGYHRRFKQKIQEGLALPAVPGGSRQ